MKKFIRISEFAKALNDGLDINKKDNNGNTYFHKYSCSYPEFLKLAVEKGYDINAVNNKGETIFHRLYQWGCLRFAISKGFDPLKKDENGKTIFHKYHSYLFEIDELSEPNITDDDGRTILFSYINYDLPSILQHMHDDLNDNDVIKGLDELKELYKTFAKALMLGANPSKKDKHGMNALQYLKWICAPVPNHDMQLFIELFKYHGFTENDVNEFHEFNEVSENFDEEYDEIIYTR